MRVDCDKERRTNSPFRSLRKLVWLRVELLFSRVLVASEEQARSLLRAEPPVEAADAVA